MKESLTTITEEEIKRYYELNKQKKAIEQEVNQLKKSFHQFLDHSVGKEQKGEVQRGNYKMHRQIRASTRYDDERTVKKLEELNLVDIIVHVKRPDTDKLEAAIELGLVEKEAFKDCKKTRITQSIIVRETFSS